MCATMEKTVVTYRLSNGTHILIHNSDPKDFDEDSNLPKSIISCPTSVYLNSTDISADSTDDAPSKADWIANDNSMEIPVMSEEVLNLPEEYNFPLSNSDELTLDPFGDIVMSFKCRTCSFLSEDRQELLEHFEVCHSEEKAPEDPTPSEDNSPEERLKEQEVPEKEASTDAKVVYLCGECNELLSSLSECRQHMLNSHNMSLNIGDEETPSLGTELNLELGLEPNLQPDLVYLEQDEESEGSQSSQSGTGRKFPCKVRGCLVKMPSAATLSTHLRCHKELFNSSGNNRTKFRCYVCSEDFTLWPRCAMHLHKEHDIDAGLLSCPSCNYKTLTRVKMANHMKTHDDARPYACTHPGCDKSFKQSTQLRNHKVLHIDRNTVAVPRWYSAQKCDICSRTYADSKCLKKHIQAVHSKLRPYVCGVCGHASARKAMLQMHARQHTGEKPHACLICPYRTGDHNSLRRHRMRHTGTKPYQCPHCPYASIQSSSYKNHLRSRHPGLPGAYSCDECDFRCVNQEALDSHAKIHLANPSSATTNFFPENAIAADMIYRCLNGGADKWRADVTGAATSADGLTQTITIRVPAEATEDEESRCFLSQHLDREEEEQVDTGGITIPADPLCL